MLEFVRVVETKEQVVVGTLHHLTLEAIEAGKKRGQGHRQVIALLCYAPLADGESPRHENTRHTQGTCNSYGGVCFYYFPFCPRLWNCSI
jgi:hypothetical protein